MCEAPGCYNLVVERRRFCSRPCGNHVLAKERGKRRQTAVQTRSEYTVVGCGICWSGTNFKREGHVYALSCEFCGIELKPRSIGYINRQKKNVGGIYCRGSCKRHEIIPRECETCKGVIKKSSKKKGKWSRFCSKVCYSVWQMSDANRRENNPNWKEHKSDKRDNKSIESRNWSASVLDRDDYTCNRCRQRGSKLRAHHLYCWSKYPDKRLDINNGVTLCKDCHTWVHSLENTTRQYILGEVPDTRNKKYQNES